MARNAGSTQSSGSSTASAPERPDDPASSPVLFAAVSQAGPSLRQRALDYLRSVYRNPLESTHVRLRAAGIAIEYGRPRLAVTAVFDGGDFAVRLERALARSGKVINGSASVAPLWTTSRRRLCRIGDLEGLSWPSPQERFHSVSAGAVLVDLDIPRAQKAEWPTTGWRAPDLCRCC